MSLSSPAPEFRQQRAPSYARGSSRGSFLAQFADGSSIEVVPSRARLYPGLRGEAPSMLPFYDAFADFMGEGRVLDAGSGSGVGTSHLLGRGLQVVAVDVDANAVAFARHQAPEAEHLCLDLVQLGLNSAVDGAIVADVLNQLQEPEAALSAIGRVMRPGASFLLAEPAAHVTQRLNPPQRRAFSVAQLRSLLVRTGFEVEAVLCESLPFVAVLARAQGPAIADTFASAYAAAAQDDIEQALAVIGRAHGSGRVSLEIELLMAECELFLARGDGDRAADTCFRAQKLAPKDARPLLGLSRIALGGHALSDALQLALDALQKDVTEPAAYAVAAVAAEGLGHPDAFTAWRAASNLAPDDAALASELSRAAAAQGDHALALFSLDRIERYGMQLTAEHHLRRAWLLIAVGRASEAAVEVRVAEAKEASESELSLLRTALSKS